MKLNDASFAMACGKTSQLPKPSRMEFAFLGRSNVGKSTLINKIVNRKSLARVSAVPGKTATINFYAVDHVYFVDLPGYGYAKTSKPEQERLKKLIYGYLSADRDLRLAVQLLDMRHAPSKDDLEMINALIDEEIPFIIVFTKADKLNKTERAKRLAAFAEEIPCFEDIHAICYSAKTFEGQEMLQTLLSDIADETDEEDDSEPEE
ncbi:MAG: YihA family ribosome biogenesis GTP-binding protein [Oscillospiraceae bacterium]|nr:YihA family ribosome biogenesis GTP-binding protein [Oscillospiraceae bacterium]